MPQPKTSFSPRTDRSGARHKPILAERFKTKMCKTYTEQGACPYEERCMFAHGDADLRTKEMNLADKLTTEDAIRAFQRVLAGEGSEASGQSPTTAPSKFLTVHNADMPPTSPTSTAPPTPKAMHEVAPAPAQKGLRFLAALCAPALDPAALSEIAVEFEPTPTKGGVAKSTPYTADERAPSPSSTNGSALRPQASEGSDSYVSALAAARATSPAMATSPSALSPSKRYRHDPYAPVELSPQASPQASRQASPQVSPRSNPLAFPNYFAPSPVPCLCVDCLVASGAVTPAVLSPCASTQVQSLSNMTPLNPRASTYCPPPKSTYCASAVADTLRGHEVLLA